MRAAAQHPAVNLDRLGTLAHELQGASLAHQCVRDCLGFRILQDEGIVRGRREFILLRFLFREVFVGLALQRGFRLRQRVGRIVGYFIARLSGCLPRGMNRGSIARWIHVVSQPASQNFSGFSRLMQRARPIWRSYAGRMGSFARNVRRSANLTVFRSDHRSFSGAVDARRMYRLRRARSCRRVTCRSRCGSGARTL